MSQHRSISSGKKKLEFLFCFFALSAAIVIELFCSMVLHAEGSKSRSKSAKPAKSPAQPSGTGNVTLAIRPSLGNEY